MDTKTKSQSWRRILLSSSVLTGLIAAAPALAAPQAQETTQAVDDPSQDIVVTARQRKETLLEAPVAVSAISGEALNRSGAVDTRDLAKLAPSLNIEHTSSGAGGVISLRGIGNSPSNVGFDQAVSVNVDGVQTGRARIMDLGLLDLAQVEVMKGPQALFFGKNSPAGVISLTSASPGKNFSGYLRTGYEFEADEAIVEGVVSGPLTQSLGARVALRYRNMQGWLTNTAGQLTSTPFGGPSNLPQAPAVHRPGEDEFMGRLTVAFQPSDSPFSATLKLAGMIHHDDGPAAGQQLYNCGAFTAPMVRYAGIATLAVDPFGNCTFDKKYSDGALPNGYATNWPGAKQNPYSNIKMFLGSLQAVYDAENYTLTSVTGLFHSDARYFDNFDATVYMAYAAAEQEKFTSVSQELRLLSKFDSPINFMIGAYYQHTNLDFINASRIAPLPVDAATGKYETWDKPGHTAGDTYSAFGQLIWKVVPTIELAGGVRYTHEVKDSTVVNSYVHPPLSGTTLALQGKVFADHYVDDNYSPEATLTWRPSKDLTTYVAYKTGYKSGGFAIGTNLIPGTITVDSIRFKAESIAGFEGGIKGRLLDRKLTFALSAYTYKYSNLQVNAYDSNTNSFKITNAASARVKGIELELNARPTSWLTFNGGISYNDAKFIAYLSDCWGGQTVALGCNVANSNGTFSQNRAGQQLARAPQWTGNIGFDARLPVTSGFTISLTSNARYSSSYYGLDNGNPSGVQPAFWVVDAGVHLTTADGKWDLALLGRNLGDTIYTGYIAEKPGAPPTPGTTSQLMATPNRGRQVMLQATFTF